MGVTLTEGFILSAAAVASSVWLNRRLLEPHIKQSMTWFTHRAKSLFPEIREIESNAANTITALTAPVDHNVRPSDTIEPCDAADDESMTLIISSDMLAPLKTLDISKQTGDFLSFKELRTAYHKSCLRTHPDKTRVESNSEFRATTEAYETLLSFMEKMLSAPSLLSEAELSLLAKIIALRKEMQEEHTIWRQMNAQAKRQTEELRRQDEHLERQGAHLEHQGAHLERQEEQLNELTEWANAERVERGLQPLAPFAPLTQEDIDGVQADPDYFVKKRQARSDAATRLPNTNAFFSTPSNEAKTASQLLPATFSAEAS